MGGALIHRILKRKQNNWSEMQLLFLGSRCLFLWFVLSFPPLCVSNDDGSLVAALRKCLIVSRSQCVYCTSLIEEDTIPSCLFTLCAPCAFTSLSMLVGGLASQVWFILVCALSLRWLRVMVTLKVCVCCSSILSSSDTLMKGHHANA